MARVTSIGSTPGPTRSTEDTSYGSIGIDLHGLAVTANEKTAYITARGVADEIKVLNLNGTDVSTILIDPRPGIADRPDGLARKGSNLYATVRFSGQVARIKTPDGQRGVHRCRATRHNRLCGSRDRGSALTDLATSVFDAEYAYLFWRPVTAIRNADLDDNGGTVVDMVGSPFLTTPPHPEYPAGHGVIQTAGTRVLEK